MNRPDKAGEPSMEEILASIRQIIADDPASDRSTPVIEANPLVPRPPSVDRMDTPQPEDIRPPLLDRLNGVLKSGALPATSPLGSKRPHSFDQDLADMFDEPGTGSDQVAAPKPEIRVPSELTYKPAPADAASKFTPDGPAAAEPTVTNSPPASLGFETIPEAPLPPPPRSFGFPPLRKQGFFPPAQTPVLPPIPAAEPANDPSSAAGEPASLDEALKRISGLGSVVPGNAAGSGSGMNGNSSIGVATPSFSFAPEPAAVEPQKSDLSFGSAPALSSEPVSPFASSTPSLSTPAAFQPAFAEPADIERPKTAVNGVGLGASHGPAFSASPLGSLREPSPFGIGADNSADVAPAPSETRYAGNPDTTAVAAQALDALAQGLAASAAASVVQSAIPLVTPVVEPEPVRVAPASSSNNLTTTALMGGGGAGPGRTLEDAVADMLRPMLQQWVADNMPRIIERALRTEVAKTTKPGSNS